MIMIILTRKLNNDRTNNVIIQFDLDGCNNCNSFKELELDNIPTTPGYTGGWWGRMAEFGTQILRNVPFFWDTLCDRCSQWRS